MLNVGVAGFRSQDEQYPLSTGHSKVSEEDGDEEEDDERRMASGQVHRNMLAYLLGGGGGMNATVMQSILAQMGVSCLCLCRPVISRTPERYECFDSGSCGNARGGRDGGG